MPINMKYHAGGCCGIREIHPSGAPNDKTTEIEITRLVGSAGCLQVFLTSALGRNLSAWKKLLVDLDGHLIRDDEGLLVFLLTKRAIS